MFSTASWHTQDQLEEGDKWDQDLDPEYDPLKPTVPAWTLLGAAAYRHVLDSYGPKPLPAFDPGFVLQSAALFTAAVGLAEIGVTRQLPQVALIPKDTYRSPESPYNKGPGWVGAPQGLAPKKSYQQYWEYGETFAWVISTAAAAAVLWVTGGGPKGRPQGKFGRSGMGTPGVGYSFSMAKNPAFAFMYGSNPLRSVTKGVYAQLSGGYVPVGTQVIKETEAGAGAEGKTFLSNPADRGNYAIYGY